MLDYAANPLRLRFLNLLPLSKELTALEIGVGFGQHTTEIARRVKWLDTLEVRWVNSMFTKIRCEQEGIANVGFKCGGDDCRLPFPDASYDIVFLNLILEWCASNIPNAPKVMGQKRLLREVYRVLKPGGLLQINTKNRFAYRLLIGGRDEHVYNMRFRKRAATLAREAGAAPQRKAPCARVSTFIQRARQTPAGCRLDAGPEFLVGARNEVSEYFCSC